MSVIFQQGKAETLVNKLDRMGVEFFFKEYDSITYVGYGGNVYAFPNGGGFNKGLFLFGLVKKDFDNWLELNPNPKFDDNYRSTLENRKLSTVTQERFAYDVDHAYWRIAYTHGYISENTYEHGIRLKDTVNEETGETLKKLYCMALSTQGQNKTLNSYIKTDATGKKLELKKDPRHKDIYNDIRNKTYKVMDEIAYLLKDDFISYNVDCIYFINKKNCKIVENYLKSKNLTFKKIK